MAKSDIGSGSTDEHYGRLFGPTQHPIGEAQESALIALGRAMRDEEVKDVNGTARAGFTYFGQFVDHDLTHDRTPLEVREVEPAAVRNHRSPFLDLDLVYGDGPEHHDELYEDGERFRIGCTGPADVPAAASDGLLHLPGGTPRDMPRDANKKPLLVDKDDLRNLENSLVMQIHVLFMNFHNIALKQCDRPELKAITRGTRFQRARQLVRWHYQWLVHQHFLYEIGDHATVYHVQHAERRLPWHARDGEIPAEFSLAAFRFGHSMVRGRYKMNCHHLRVCLTELMRTSYAARSLPEDALFEWGRLFPWLPRSGDEVTPSAPINTAITPALHELPDHTRRLFSDPSQGEHHPELPVRTLLRGARAKLASGQEVASALVQAGLLNSADVLTEPELTGRTGASNDASGAVLGSNGLARNTPLFYYVLKEAEVKKRGRRLGPLGSRIVAEVIESILRRDDSSYLKRFGFNWKLPLWLFPDEKAEPVDSMTQLVKLVGDPLPQGCREKLSSRLHRLFPTITKLVARSATRWRGR